MNNILNSIEKNIQIFLNEQIQNNQSFIMVRNNSYCINIGNYTMNNIIEALNLYKNKKFDQISIIQLNSSNKLILINQNPLSNNKKIKLLWKKNKETYSLTYTIEKYKKINKNVFINYYFTNNKKINLNLSKDILLKIFDFLI